MSTALSTFIAGPVAVDDAPDFPNPKDERTSKLMCADVSGNNNKFYTLILQKSSKGQWRCFVNYGRVGAAGRMEVRAHGSQRADAEDVFEKLLHEKTRGGRYREVQIVADTGGKAVAVVPKGKGGIVQARDAWRSGARAPASWSAPAQKFYNALLYEAQCLVETGMQASSVSSAGLQTPLGIVGEDDLREAQKVLEQIALAIQAGHHKGTSMKVSMFHDLNSHFFKIIPTPIGGTRVKLRDMMIVDGQQVADKQQLLDSALGLIAAQQPGPSNGKGIRYPVLLEDIDKDEGKMLNDLLRAERCSCHKNERLKWSSAFKVTRPADVAKFRKDLAPKDLFLFHGTRRATGAGILSRGLLPTKAATAAGGNYSGSAFGDGIYFASNAGKSLGYTDGNDGERLMFVSLVAMGKPQIHKGWSYNTRRGAGFDSIHAKASSSGLAHDEIIVPATDRTCIAYVMEV